MVVVCNAARDEANLRHIRKPVRARTRARERGVCGVYCVYFIRELVERNLGSCLTMFSDNLAKNDQYVLNYLKNI